MNTTCIIELTAEEALNFFLESDSYCNASLPPYITFKDLLSEINSKITVESEIWTNSCLENNLSHTIYCNKDGKYAWRPIQLINPFLYVLLAQLITKEKNWECIKKRFNQFQSLEKIKCFSLPVKSNSNRSNKAEQIMKWWESIEQESIIQGLGYSHLMHVDISDCYGSIYTHSIAWALHDKDEAKKNVAKKIRIKKISWVTKLIN